MDLVALLLFAISVAFGAASTRFFFMLPRNSSAAEAPSSLLDDPQDVDFVRLTGNDSNSSGLVSLADLHLSSSGPTSSTMGPLQLTPALPSTHALAVICKEGASNDRNDFNIIPREIKFKDESLTYNSNLNTAQTSNHQNIHPIQASIDMSR